MRHLETVHEIKNEGRARCVVLRYTVTPARPAPACSNPDSPAFSDSGDPGEVCISAAWLVREKSNRKRKLPERIIDSLNNCDGLIAKLYEDTTND